MFSPPQHMSAPLFGLGQPLLDISIDAPQSIFEQYGLVCPNAILAGAEHMPIYDQICADFQPVYVPGGSCQNSMRVANWLLNEPNTAVFCGRIGNDKYGQRLQSVAKHDHFDARYIVKEDEFTGVCAVLIQNHDRSMVTDLRTSKQFSQADLEQCRPHYEAAKFIVLEGYFLATSRDAVLTIAKHSAEQQKFLVLGLASPFICQFFTEDVLESLKYTNMVFCNETEAETLAKKLGWDVTGDNWGEICMKMAQLPMDDCVKGDLRKRVVVLSRGPKPLYVGTAESFTVYQVPVVENPVDANGSGDALLGGYVAALVKGKDQEGCVQAGIYCAQYILCRSGTQLTDPPQFKL